MDDLERRIDAEIARLSGDDFPTGRLAERQRATTIRALAEASAAGHTWTGEKGVLGRDRKPNVISQKNFYNKKHWYPHPLTREVIARVTEIYVQRNAAERELRRQVKKAELEMMEEEAARQQFDKAKVLLEMSTVSKRTTRWENGVEQTIYLAPANASMFRAAADLAVKGSDLFRRSLGLPVEVRRNELSGPEGGAITTRADSMEGVSTDDIQRSLEELARGTLVVLAAVDDRSLDDDEGGSADDDPESEE